MSVFITGENTQHTLSWPDMPEGRPEYPGGPFPTDDWFYRCSITTETGWTRTTLVTNSSQTPPASVQTPPASVVLDKAPEANHYEGLLVAGALLLGYLFYEIRKWRRQ